MSERSIPQDSGNGTLSLELHAGEFPHVLINDGEGGQIILAKEELKPLAERLIEAFGKIEREIMAELLERAVMVLQETRGN